LPAVWVAAFAETSKLDGYQVKLKSPLFKALAELSAAVKFPGPASAPVIEAAAVTTPFDQPVELEETIVVAEPPVGVQVKV
jgi:hypothetical protein